MSTTILFLFIRAENWTRRKNVVCWSWTKPLKLSMRPSNTKMKSFVVEHASWKVRSVKKKKSARLIVSPFSYHYLFTIVMIGVCYYSLSDDLLMELRLIWYFRRKLDFWLGWWVWRTSKLDLCSVNISTKSLICARVPEKWSSSLPNWR